MDTKWCQAVGGAEPRFSTRFQSSSSMKFSRICSILLTLLLCGQVLANGFDVNARFDTQKLLERLRTAQGDTRSIAIVGLLAKLKDGELSGSDGSPIACVIEAVEEIIVFSRPLHSSRRFLSHVQIATSNLARLDREVHSRLAALPRDSQLVFGSSLSKIALNYLNHEMHSMRRLKRRLYTGTTKSRSVELEIEQCLLHCKIALATTLKSVSLFQSRDIVAINNFLRGVFHKNREPHSQDLNANLAVSIAAQSSPTALESDIKFLRETLVVLVKSGMFMFFCFAFQIYVCSFTFGVLLTLSSLIWIAVFLQMIDV